MVSTGELHQRSWHPVIALIANGLKPGACTHTTRTRMTYGGPKRGCTSLLFAAFMWQRVGEADDKHHNVWYMGEQR